MKITRSILFICCFTLFFNEAICQNVKNIELAETPSRFFVSIQPDVNFRTDTDPVKRYKKLRTSGIVLSVVGTSVTMAGGLGIKKDKDLGKTNPNRKDASMYKGMGVGLIGVGAAGVLSGIPLWIIGDHKLKKAKENVFIHASPVSAGLGYKF